MDQVRYFKLDCDRLVVETAPATNPNLGKVVPATSRGKKSNSLFALTEQDRNRRRLAALHCRLVAHRVVS